MERALQEFINPIQLVELIGWINTMFMMHNKRQCTDNTKRSRNKTCPENSDSDCELTLRAGAPFVLVALAFLFL